MDCTTFETSLPRFLDGTLDEKSAGSMEAHIQDCTVCAALQAAHRIVDGALTDAEPVPAPTGFDARLFEAIAREEAIEQLARTWKRQIFVAVAAFAGVIPVYAWMVYWWLRHDAFRLSGVFSGLLSSIFPVAGLRGSWDRILDAGMVSRTGAALTNWMKPIPLPATDIAVSPLYIFGMIVVLAVWIWYESTPMMVPRYPGAIRTGRR
jgi:hypothetical protein